MQTLEVISINIWQMLISLFNLLLLFLILKKFLYKPVKKMLASRQAAIDESYNAASIAESEAQANKKIWQERLDSAQSEADSILESARLSANRRSAEIIADADEKAEGILRRAKSDAELERKKASADIRNEIIDISTLLTEKMLGKEINERDHRGFIDSFIDNIGADNGTNE